jgi:hypothetical protein
VAASQISRSISSSEKNHGLRFEGILKIQFARKSPSKGQKPDILGARLIAFYEARLKPGEDISVLLHDDARRKELSRRAWSGEEP